MQLQKLQRLLLPVLATAVLAPSSLLAQDFSDSDSREIASYVLNDASLDKFAKASRNLGEITDQLPSNCDDEEDAQSLDELAGRLDAIPEVHEAIVSAGMTSREYLVFSFSLFQNGMAAWVLSQPGGTLPEGTSMANVDFYRQHEATFQELGSLTQTDECDDAYEEDEEYDEEEGEDY